MTDYLAPEAQRSFPWVLAAVLTPPIYAAGWYIGMALTRWIGT